MRTLRFPTHSRSSCWVTLRRRRRRSRRHAWVSRRFSQATRSRSRRRVERSTTPSVQLAGGRGGSRSRREHRVDHDPRCVVHSGVAGRRERGRAARPKLAPRAGVQAADEVLARRRGCDRRPRRAPGGDGVAEGGSTCRAPRPSGHLRRTPQERADGARGRRRARIRHDKGRDGRARARLLADPRAHLRGAARSRVAT